MAEFTFNFPGDGKTWSMTVQHNGKSWTEQWKWEPDGYICTTLGWDDDLPDAIRNKLDELPFDGSEVAFRLHAATPEGGEIDLFDDLGDSTSPAGPS